MTESRAKKEKQPVPKEDRRGEPVVMRTGTVSRGSNESKLSGEGVKVGLRLKMPYAAEAVFHDLG